MNELDVCASCRKPLAVGSTVAILGFCKKIGRSAFTALTGRLYLCESCGCAANAEMLYATEPGRMIMEIAPALQTDPTQRQLAHRLALYISGFLENFEKQLGRVVRRIRIEPEDDDNFRLIVVTDDGNITFNWSKCSNFLVGADQDSKDVVFKLKFNSGIERRQYEAAHNG